MRWKAAVQAESDEQRLIHYIPMRESPFIVPHLQRLCLK